MWVHPQAPEDELDRVCFRIWKRSVWANKHIWPHQPENAQRFADEKQHVEDVNDENQRNGAFL